MPDMTEEKALEILEAEKVSYKDTRGECIQSKKSGPNMLRSLNWSTHEITAFLDGRFTLPQLRAMVFLMEREQAND